MMEGLVAAIAFLTILPVHRLAGTSASPGKMFSFFPLVGLLIGAVIGLVASIGFLPSALTALLTLGVWVVLTGGLHLDGLADACDGLFSTFSPERRLEIMQDPRTGAWGVVGITLVLLGKWAALRTLPPALLLIPPIAGRWGMVLAVAAFPNARASGLAAHFRDGFGRTQLVIASLLTLVLMAGLSFLVSWRAAVVCAITPLAVLLIGGWAARRLGGGLTGDVVGALCEVVELICLITLNIS
jgi:adenosylcobinamide-GDP ribazoletransferase